MQLLLQLPNATPTKLHSILAARGYSSKCGGYVLGLVAL